MLNKRKGLQRSLNIHQKRGQQAGSVLSKSCTGASRSGLPCETRGGEGKLGRCCQHAGFHSLSHRHAETVGECCCYYTQETQTAVEDRNFTFRNLKYVYRELRQADPSPICWRFKSPKHVPTIQTRATQHCLQAGPA